MACPRRCIYRRRFPARPAGCAGRVDWRNRPPDADAHVRRVSLGQRVGRRRKIGVRQVNGRRRVVPMSKTTIHLGVPRRSEDMAKQTKRPVRPHRVGRKPLPEKIRPADDRQAADRRTCRGVEVHDRRRRHVPPSKKNSVIPQRNRDAHEEGGDVDRSAGEHAQRSAREHGKDDGCEKDSDCVTNTTAAKKTSTAKNTSAAKKTPAKKTKQSAAAKSPRPVAPARR